jgi:hypothetical protein
MARKKLYYTADEIVTGLYTAGNEFILPNGNNYIGQYHRYTTGEIFSGPTWNPKTSTQLIPAPPTVPAAVKLYKQLNPDVRTAYQIPKHVPVTITNADLERGYVKRFILSKHTDRTIIEVDLTQYEQWQQSNIDHALYDAYAINWYITGNLYTETINGVTKPGVYNRNLNTITQLKTINPGIATYLASPIQFYTDTTVNVPKNINALDF